MDVTTDELPIVDPEHNVSYGFERRGDNLLVRSELRPGAILPKHKHPVQEEIWWVESGEVEIFIDGEWRPADAATGRVVVEPGVVHGLRNRGTEPARLGTDVIPAMDLEEFLTEAAWAAREGLIKRGGIPRSLKGLGWAARFLRRHSDDTVMSFPPPFVVRLMRPLERLGA